MRVGIFARRLPAPEPQHDRYRAACLGRGHVVVDLDVSAFITGSVGVDVDGGAFVVGASEVRFDAADLDVVLVGALPGPAARTAPDGVVVGADVHAAATRVQVERHLLARALVAELEARGVPCVSPVRSFALDNKLSQLFALRRAGLPVPRTRVGNVDPPDDDGAWIVKPLSSGRARLFGDAHTAATQGQPRIVQRRIVGDDLRAIVVGGACLGVGRFPRADRGADADVVDLRDRPGFVDGAQPWLPDDDAVAADLAVRAAAACHVDVAAVDLVRGEDGVVVLEVNRTAVLADLGDDLGVDVDSAVVDLLERRGRR